MIGALPATSSALHEAALIELALVLFGVTIAMNIFTLRLRASQTAVRVVAKTKTTSIRTL